MGTVISAKDAWIRLGTDGERDYDRRLIYMFQIGAWRYEWRKAKAEKDYEAMDHLDKWLNNIESL
jgi:hypothetical protein